MAENDGSNAGGILRCMACRSMLNPSGREPYRFVCGGCRRHYFATMQLVEVPADDRNLLALPGGDDAS